jgi:predicted nuclease with RNAse H fold
MAIIGIDLKASPNRASAVAILDGTSAGTRLEFFQTNDDFLKIAAFDQPILIAIGAPLGLPSGLCCLETSCPCELIDPHQKGRHSELDLSRMGISCFFTNKRSIISASIYRAINLSSELVKQGHKVIEVYPYATKVLLMGDKLPPKNTARSLIFLRDRLPGLIFGLEPHLDTLDRSQCDALLNAYTALLHVKNQTDVLGVPEEGFLVLPELHR